MNKKEVADYIANECGGEPCFLYREKPNVIVVQSGRTKYRVTVERVTK